MANFIREYDVATRRGHPQPPNPPPTPRSSRLIHKIGNLDAASRQVYWTSGFGMWFSTLVWFTPLVVPVSPVGSASSRVAVLFYDSHNISRQ